MTDKELIELAAKSAGITGTWHRSGYVAYSGWSSSIFDPLNDDGDALRLTVKLGIEFYMEGYESSECVWANEIFEWTDGDAMKATRRAITSAAAQIGKEME